MAITPYRQTVGVPTQASGVSPIVPAADSNISSSFRGLGLQLQTAFEPQLTADAQRRAREDAGAFVMTRDEDGNLQMPPPAEDGGLRYREAFDSLIETRYLSAVGNDYQQWLDEEVAARQTGERPYDPASFRDTVEARTEGILQGVDPRLRPQVEVLFAREAQERVRAFTNEWGRTRRQQLIKGGLDQIGFHFMQAANWRNNGLDADEVLARHIAPVTEIIERLRNIGGMGDAEADALFMQSNNLTDGVQRYVESMETVVPIIPLIGGLGLSDVQMLRYWLSGAEVEGELTGLVSEGSGVVEVVTPDVLRAMTQELWGVEPTSVDRAPNHPLSEANPGSAHNTANGGRAVDMPAIDGLEIEDVVAGYEAAGFEVIRFKDEYADPSPWATGGHWHFEFGNTRGVTTTRQVGMPIDFETANGLDPAVKELMLNVLTDREQAIRSEATIAREEARERARVQREQENTQRIIDGINARNAGGFGGNYSAEETSVLERSFEASVNMANMSDPAEQNRALSFVQQNDYVPENLVQYISNMVRSEDIAGPLAMYRTLENATLRSGVNVGDRLVRELDNSTVALLEEASSLERSGQSMEQIVARLERVRSGDGFTVEQARTAYNSGRANGDLSYTERSDQLLRETFGLPENTAIDPQLRGDFDSLYASNLDVADRNPERAMSSAVRQLQRRVSTSDAFLAGVGPSILLETYTRQQILDFFVNETHDDTGEPLLPPGRHRFGGNGNVRLVPLDSNTSGIGRYRVVVTDPENPVEIVEVFEVDLGRELREYYSNQAQGGQVDHIGNARRDHEGRTNWLTEFGRRADNGPRY